MLLLLGLISGFVGLNAQEIIHAGFQAYPSVSFSDTTGQASLRRVHAGMVWPLSQKFDTANKVLRVLESELNLGMAHIVADPFFDPFNNTTLQGSIQYVQTKVKRYGWFTQLSSVLSVPQKKIGEARQNVLLISLYKRNFSPHWSYSAGGVAIHSFSGNFFLPLLGLSYKTGGGFSTDLLLPYRFDMNYHWHNGKRLVFSSGFSGFASQTLMHDTIFFTRGWLSSLTYHWKQGKHSSFHVGLGYYKSRASNIHTEEFSRTFSPMNGLCIQAGIRVKIGHREEHHLPDADLLEPEQLELIPEDEHSDY